MLPNTKELDSEKKMAVLSGYMGVVESMAAHGVDLSEEVKQDISGIGLALVEHKDPYSDKEPLSSVSGDSRNEDLRIIGAVAALEAQYGLPR